MLEASDDAATVSLGSNAFTPTMAQLKELKDNCTWTWETLNGWYGYKITASNGNSIFLPAAGVHYTTDGCLNNEKGDSDSFGGYWTSTLTTPTNFTQISNGEQQPSVGAVSLEIEGNTNKLYSNERMLGLTIRPVTSSTAYDISAATVTGITTGKTESSPYTLPTITVTSGEKTLIEDIHYTVTITNNSGANVLTPLTTIGGYTVTIKGINGCTGSKSYTVYINGYDLSDATISGVENGGTYADPFTVPAITVTTSDGETLYENIGDYVMTNSNGEDVTSNTTLNADKYTLTITPGTDSYNTNSKTVTFKVYNHDISSATVTGIEANKSYTLEEAQEAVNNIVVKDGDTTLTKGTDYTIELYKTGAGGVTTLSEGTFKISIKCTNSTIGEKVFENITVTLSE